MLSLPGTFFFFFLVKSVQIIFLVISVFLYFSNII